MDARIAVIGAGYVGLPLAVAFAEAGHAVLCVEPDAPRVARINAGDSYIKDVTLRDAHAARDRPASCAPPSTTPRWPPATT